jgi:hypothetical protein
VDAPWQDFASVPDVGLVPVDAQPNPIDLASSQPIQLARGSRVSDADGPRQAALMFPAGTTATMTLPDGTTRALSSLTVRATEFTVGPGGPSAMPAELPPTSAYTYALDLSVDEAGSNAVRFDRPLPLYVENFLNFPVGGAVPLGSYDAATATWVPAESGRVVEVVGVTSGMADLDLDGDGRPDSATSLASLGISDAERQQLASLYSVGQSLWRVRIPHFSTWDLNWSAGLPADAVAESDDPTTESPIDNRCTEDGHSVVGCPPSIARRRRTGPRAAVSTSSDVARAGQPT